MSDHYEQARKAACVHCKAGEPMYHARSHGNQYMAEACTAPSAEEFIEQQAARIYGLEKVIDVVLEEFKRGAEKWAEGKGIMTVKEAREMAMGSLAEIEKQREQACQLEAMMTACPECEQQAARISALREAVAWSYQLAGLVGAPVEALDNLSALANEDPPPHEWPVALVPQADDLEKQQADREAELRGEIKRSVEQHLKKRIEELESVLKYEIEEKNACVQQVQRLQCSQGTTVTERASVFVASVIQREIDLTADLSGKREKKIEKLEAQVIKLREEISSAAQEIHCAGPLVHRIQMLKRLHGEQISELEKQVADMEPVAAFGHQCIQDRCENAYVEASVVKRLEAELRESRDLIAKNNTDASNIISKLRSDLTLARQDLVLAAIPLEVLAGQIAIEKYREISPEMQKQIISAVALIRTAVATEPTREQASPGARKDTDLLDWLDSRGDIGTIVIDADLAGEAKTIRWSHFESETVRSAIESAMSALPDIPLEDGPVDA